jgi:DNA repair exonuclease SbcCD ATPase subunit
MSKLSKKNLVASAIIGAFAFSASNVASADALKDIQKAEAKIFNASAKSQNKINSLYEQSQELLAEYRQVVDEAEVLKGYNDHVQRMVDDQQANINSLQKQIDGIDKIKQGVVPLMYKMIDTLEKFVDLDIPVNVDGRKERIENLKKVMNDSNVTTSEQFRLVLEAYEIEANYGTVFAAYQGELDLGDRKITADFVHMGRVTLLAQSLDLKNAWVWNNGTRSWDQLGDEYLKPVTTAVRMARKQLSPDLAKLPVFAAGAQ